MRTLFGMIIGCLLTVAAVYVHDTASGSDMQTGPAAGQHGRIVNWDVAASEWDRMTASLRGTWDRLTRRSGEVERG